MARFRRGGGRRMWRRARRNSPPSRKAAVETVAGAEPLQDGDFAFHFYADTVVAYPNAVVIFAAGHLLDATDLGERRTPPPSPLTCF